MFRVLSFWWGWAGTLAILLSAAQGSRGLLLHGGPAEHLLRLLFSFVFSILSRSLGEPLLCHPVLFYTEIPPIRKLELELSDGWMWLQREFCVCLAAGLGHPGKSREAAFESQVWFGWAFRPPCLWPGLDHQVGSASGFLGTQLAGRPWTPLPSTRWSAEVAAAAVPSPGQPENPHTQPEVGLGSFAHVSVQGCWWRRSHGGRRGRGARAQLSRIQTFPFVWPVPLPLLCWLRSEPSASWVPLPLRRVAPAPLLFPGLPRCRLSSRVWTAMRRWLGFLLLS